MATLTGTRIHDCPTCHWLTPYPEAIRDPVCVNCVRHDWPADIRQTEHQLFVFVLKLAIVGLLLLMTTLNVLSALGYL